MVALVPPELLAQFQQRSLLTMTEPQRTSSASTFFTVSAPDRPDSLQPPPGEGVGSGRLRNHTRENVLEALKQHNTIQEAAQALGYTPQHFHMLAKRDPAIQSAMRDKRQQYEQQVGEALTKARGNMAQAARLLGAPSTASLRYYVHRTPRLRATLQEFRENILDTAEANIYTDVEKGSIRSSWKLLQTLGKDRGFTERRETTHTGTIHHDVRHHTTRSLVSALDELAELSPEAVEAEFVNLPAEDRSLLTAALDRHQQDAADESPDDPG